jgi:hypothetical protein
VFHHKVSSSFHLDSANRFPSNSRCRLFSGSRQRDSFSITGPFGSGRCIVAKEQRIAQITPGGRKLPRKSYRMEVLEPIGNRRRRCFGLEHWGGYRTQTTGVPSEFDALFAAAKRIVAAAVGANGSASLRKTGCQGILLRGEVLFIEVDAKALNPLKTTSIHNAARMVESCATNPIRGGPARKPT